MTMPEPIRLTDLEGALSSAQRAELAAYRQTGPGADLKLEMWENLERTRAADAPSPHLRGRYTPLRWWGLGVLCSGLLAGLLLRPQKESEPTTAPPRTPPAQLSAAQPAPAPTPVIESPAEPQPSAAAKPRRARAEPVARADALEELKLLTRARRVLPSRPETTLALSGEHAQLYPRGALAEEREVLAIEALVKLGRASQARLRARAFVRQFPDSSQRARLNALLEQSTQP